MFVLNALSAKVFVSEYTYHASEMDSKISSRIFATEQVKKQVLQQIGMYVSTEVIHYSAETNGILKEMSSSEISIIAAGIVSFSILEETWNGSSYWIKAQVEADPEDVIKALDALAKEKEKVSELKETRAIAEAALVEAENLRRELQKAKDELELTKLQSSYNSASNIVEAKAWLDKAYISIRAQNWDLAFEQYSKAVEFNPELAPAYAGLGNISHYRNQIEKAIEFYEKAITLKTTLIHPYKALSDIYIDQKQYHKAISICEKTLQTSPSSYPAYYKLAFAYHALGDAQKAMNYLDQGIKIHPEVYQEAHNFKGMIYLEQGQWSMAIESYQAALKSTGHIDDARSYTGLGFAYIQLNDIDKAITNLELGNKISPQDQMILANLGWAYYLKKEYAKSLANLELVLIQNPRDANISQLAGAVYCALNKPDQAISYFEKSLQIDPNNHHTINGIGWVYYLKKDYPKAISWFQKALATNAKFDEPYYNLGLAYDAIGNTKAAEQNYQKAASMNHAKAKEKLNKTN